MISNQVIIAVALNLLGALACSDSSPQSPGGNTKNDTALAGGEALSHKEPRPKVSGFLLDDHSFRINGFRAGKQQFMQSETPFLSFFKPSDADYVEIMRCHADTVINGPDGSLVNVDLSASSVEEEIEAFVRNDFWQAAESSSGCLVISENFSEDNFYDGYAQGGRWRYVARPCVDPSRLRHTEGIGSRNCSKQVAISPWIEHRNVRETVEIEALEKATKLRAEVEALARETYDVVVEYNNAIMDCEKRNRKALIAQRKKAAITHIIGQGVSIAAAFYGGGGDLFAEGASTAQKIKGIWDNQNQIAANGNAFGGMLLDLFGTASENLKACSVAERIQRDADITVKELKAKSLNYAGVIELAETEAKKRRQIETSKVTPPAPEKDTGNEVNK